MVASGSRRYAQAVFELSQEHGGLDIWEEDLDKVNSVLVDEDFRDFLSAPQIPVGPKLDGVKTLLADVQPLVRNFVSLLVIHSHVNLFPDIYNNFRMLADESRGIVRGEIVTAYPLTKKQRTFVLKRLSRIVGAENLVTTERVDPSIISGLIARIGDHLIDGSTKTRFQDLRKNLKHAAFRFQQENLKV